MPHLVHQIMTIADAPFLAQLHQDFSPYMTLASLYTALRLVTFAQSGIAVSAASIDEYDNVTLPPPRLHFSTPPRTSASASAMRGGSGGSGSGSSGERGRDGRGERRHAARNHSNSNRSRGSNPNSGHSLRYVLFNINYFLYFKGINTRVHEMHMSKHCISG